MLEVRDARVDFDGTTAFRDVDLDLPDGSVTAVLGPSGCGKSTLLRAIAGLEPLTDGSVRWDGQDLARVPTHRRGFALMFQDGQLFTHLTVAANVGYPLRVRGRRDPERVAGLLDLVGLGPLAERLPGTLSGGERQRVALARSLAADPRLLLLDEPFSALDAALRHRLAGEVRDILRAEGTTTLMVTHDRAEAFALADRLVLMRGGWVVQSGPTDEVWTQPADEQAALALGYRSVLSSDQAHHLGLGGSHSVALAERALSMDPAGPIPGHVTAVRRAPDAVVLTVEVGRGIDVTVIQDDTGSAAPGPGDAIQLQMNEYRTARVGG